MPSQPKQIPYRCPFCRERLQTAERRWFDYLKLLVFVRPFQCPHCFQIVERPIAFIGRIFPSRDTSNNDSQAVTRQPSTPPFAGSQGGIYRGIRRIGRVMTMAEESVIKFARSAIRLVCTGIAFLPRRLFSLGRIARRRTNSKN